jgi:hypothetical protein
LGSIAKRYHDLTTLCSGTYSGSSGSSETSVSIEENVWSFGGAKFPFLSLTRHSFWQALERPFQVLKTLGPEAIGVLITDGDGGVSYAFEKVGGRMDAFTVPCVDSTGGPNPKSLNPEP